MLVRKFKYFSNVISFFMLMLLMFKGFSQYSFASIRLISDLQFFF